MSAAEQGVGHNDFGVGRPSLFLRLLGTNPELQDTSGRCTAVAPYDPGRPCEIRIEYTKSDEVERFRHRAGVEVVDGRTIASRADDWWTAWRQFYF